MFVSQFITSDVYGLFCWSFCDFGDSFEVMDPNGEEPKETFIAKITKVNDLKMFLSPPVPLHGGLICIAFRLYSVCHLTKIQTRKKFISQKVLKLGV